jgi:hypothetical protein
MAKKKDHITKSDEFQRYLNNQMSAGERHAFEKKLLEADFEQEALEGMEQFSPEEIGSDLSQLQITLSKKARTESGFNYWRAAAAVGLLVIFSYCIYYVIDGDSSNSDRTTKGDRNKPIKSHRKPLSAAIPDSAS